ncbi:hypothetical protein C9374_012732 [Naegleria lovaniensis]|uniref:START domain-containing protein n=1 Tax=Naegleria lovaniensis TaxID=51637 RepID=A0AA88GWY1_NAELO|nr:uncharacterized protein C9374_012732 [Naegleria lovaniensis]KAG2392480.1 hypothetical protein C9374_012732 [Naegleria lovaniensis]
MVRTFTSSSPSTKNNAISILVSSQPTLPTHGNNYHSMTSTQSSSSASFPSSSSSTATPPPTKPFQRLSTSSSSNNNNNNPNNNNSPTSTSQQPKKNQHHKKDLPSGSKNTKKHKKKSHSSSSHKHLHDYTFSFEAILDDEETRLCLLLFMRSQRNEESLLFLEYCNEYYRKRSTVNRYTCLREIHDQFFKENAPHELNLPQREREMMIFSYMDMLEEIAHRKRMKEEEPMMSLSNSSGGGGAGNTNNTNQQSEEVSLSSLDYLDLGECESALKKAESYILVNIKEHVMPQFIESPMFQEFISTKSKTFLNTIGTAKNLSHSCFVESLMEMKKCEMTIDQVRMIKKHVLDEKNWDLVFQKDDCYGYMSSNRYILGREEETNNEGVFFAKCEVIFPYSCEAVMNIMTNVKVRLGNDKNLHSIKRIGYRNKSGVINYTHSGSLANLDESREDNCDSASHSNYDDSEDNGENDSDDDDDDEDDDNDYYSTSSSSSSSATQSNPSSTISGKTKLATVLSHEVYKLAWPFKNRYYILAQSMLHDSTSNMYIIAKKSCEPPNYNPKETNYIRALNIGCWMFAPVIRENVEHCKYIQFVGTDLKGSVPSWLIEKIIKKRTKNFYQDTMRMIQKSEALANTRPEDSCGYFDTLAENGSIAL